MITEPKKYRFIFTEQNMDSSGNLVIDRGFTYPIIQVWDFHTHNFVPCSIKNEGNQIIIRPGYMIFDPPTMQWIDIIWSKLVVVVVE